MSDWAKRITATPDRTFKYSHLEAAIASIHNVPERALKTFKSRLKHFQRIGLVPSSPGRGQKIEYKIVDAIRWALCFEFAELGLPPDQIKLIIRICEQPLLEPFAGPLQAEDWIFFMRGGILEWHLNAAIERAEGAIVVGPLPAACGARPASKISEIFSLKGRPLFARALMINLTHLKRELGKALGVDWC
jgi:hypothetical protein